MLCLGRRAAAAWRLASRSAPLPHASSALSLPVPLPLRFFSTASSPPSSSASCGVVPDINHAGMTAWRRDLHKHPEIGFEEHRTSDVVAALLESFGAEVTRGVATTGLVGTICGSGGDGGDGGGGGRSLGLRADMDALPMTEGDTTPGSTSIPPYRSVHEGRFHGCGHDGHTSMLLGAAEYLGRHRSSFSGTVHFIFQPAEENGHGAREMMREGLFERFPCDESETDGGAGGGGGEGRARAREREREGERGKREREEGKMGD